MKKVKKLCMAIVTLVMIFAIMAGSETCVYAKSVNKQAGKAYAKILNEYFQVSQAAKSDNYSAWDDSNHPNVNLEYKIGLFGDRTPIYRIFDYNDDGQPELFIGIKSDTTSATIYDVYTFHNGKAVQLMANIGNREGTCIFRKNGIIEDWSSGSASYSNVTYWKMPKGKAKLAEVVSIEIDTDAKAKYTKYVNGKKTVISEKEVDAIRKKYGKEQKYTFYQLTNKAVKEVKNGKFSYKGQKNWRITT